MPPVTWDISWLHAFVARPASCMPRHGLLSMADESRQDSLLLTAFMGCSGQELADLHLQLHFTRKSSAFQQSLWICWASDISPKRHARSWKQCVFVGSGAALLVAEPGALPHAGILLGRKARVSWVTRRLTQEWKFSHLSGIFPCIPPQVAALRPAWCEGGCPAAPFQHVDKSRLKQFPSRALVTLPLLFLGGGKASSA